MPYNAEVKDDTLVISSFAKNKSGTRDVLKKLKLSELAKTVFSAEIRNGITTIRLNDDTVFEDVRGIAPGEVFNRNSSFFGTDFGKVDIEKGETVMGRRWQPSVSHVHFGKTYVETGETVMGIR